MSENKTKKKRGPSPRPEDQQRKHRISIFLTDSEYQLVKHKAGDYKLPDYVRTSAVGGAFAPKPATIPKLNLEAWKKLGRTTNNLNQLVRLLHIQNHEDVAIDVTAVSQLLADFRSAIVGGEA